MGCERRRVLARRIGSEAWRRVVLVEIEGARATATEGSVEEGREKFPTPAPGRLERRL